MEQGHSDRAGAGRGGWSGMSLPCRLKKMGHTGGCPFANELAAADRQSARFVVGLRIAGWPDHEHGAFTFLEDTESDGTREAGGRSRPRVRSDADEVGVEGLRRLADRFDDMGVFNDANLGVDGGNAGSVGDLFAQLICALGDVPGTFGRSRRFADMGDAHGAILIDDRVGVGESMRATWFQVGRDQHAAAWMHGRRGFQSLWHADNTHRSMP